MKHISTSVKFLALLLAAVIVLILAAVSGLNAFGQVTTGGNSIQAGNTLFVSKTGSDSSGTRGRADRPFLTIGRAKTNAVAGDTIFVYPGTYNENNLLKGGVNYFMPGVTLQMAPSNAATNSYLGIFDDRLLASGTTNYIWGRPNIIYHTGTNGPDLGGIGGSTVTDSAQGGATNSVGPIFITNALTRFYAELGVISFGSLQDVGLPPAAVHIRNCAYASVNVLEITNMFYGGLQTTNQDEFGGPVLAQDESQAVYWMYGETHMNCQHIGKFSFYAIWTDDSGTVHLPADFYYAGDYIEQKIYQTGSTLNYRTWFDLNEIKTTNASGFSCFNIVGGKSYLRCKKISDTGTAGSHCIDVASGAQVWVDCEKLSAGHNNGSFIFMANAASLWANIDHFEDSGSLTNGIAITSAGAELHLRGGQMVITNGVGIWHTAGTNHIEGLAIDTSKGTGTNKWPVLVGGNGLYLQNCVLVAPASTETLHAASAFNVGLLGTVAANSNKSANVTFTPTNANWFGVDANVK